MSEKATNSNKQTRRKYLQNISTISAFGVGLSTITGRAKSETDASNILVIEGSGSRTNYTFSTDGIIKPLQINNHDTVWKSRAEGFVGTGVDRYILFGDLTNISLDGTATVYLNNEEINPETYGKHILTIEGKGTRANYRFTVSGSIEPVQVNDHDTVRNNGAEGFVGTGVDRYAFSGDLWALNIEGNVVVYLDEKYINPHDYPDSVLTFKGSGTRTNYRFTVSGSVRPLQINNHDTIHSNDVQGFVGTGIDHYGIQGNIVSFTQDGDAEVYIDGERVKQDTIGSDIVTDSHRAVRISPGADSGFTFESRFNSTMGDTEGVTFHNGDLYTTTDVSRGKPATIERYDTDGNLIDSFTAEEINHPNTLVFHNELLWVGEADPPNSSHATSGVIIDWDAKRVVKEIVFNSHAFGQQLRCSIPTQNNETKFLFTEFDFDRDNVARGCIVDPEGTFESGVTSGNIDVVFDADWLTRMQAAAWVDGFLYATTHHSISKHRFPYADQIQPESSPFSSIEWFHPRPTYNGSVLYDLEQLSYNPTDDIWYINANGGTYQCEEFYGERRIGEWGRWNYRQGIGFGENTALELNGNVASGQGDVELFAIGKSAIVEVWVYDDGLDGKSYCTILDGKDRQSLGFETSVSSNNYILDGNNQSKTDTGIARPNPSSWTKFRWTMHGDYSQQFISTDSGATWQSVGERTTGANAVSGLRVMIDADAAAAPLIGTWTIQFIR